MAVITPVRLALPSPVIVTPIPGPKEPLPTLKQVLEVTIPTNSALPEVSTVTPDPALMSDKVEKPAVTTIPPAVILTPVLAVTRPTASTLVTSS